MTSSQLVLNNSILVIVAFIIVVIKIKHHLLAYKASNDLQVLAAITELRKSQELDIGNSIVLNQGVFGYVPRLQMERKSQVALDSLLRSSGFKQVKLSLFVYYYAQQDLARFRYIVKSGSKYKAFHKMSFQHNVKWLLIYGSVGVLAVLLFSFVLQNSVGQ